MQEQASTTRERILEAATVVFLNNGFANATVRDICSRAGANVAAVNYHFKDKSGLFRAVLENIMQSHLEAYPPDMGLTPESPPEDRLEVFVRSFLSRLILGDGKRDPALSNKLIAQAMVVPSPFLDHLAKFHMMPMRDIISDIVSAILEAPKDQELVRFASAGIIGQILFYFYLRPALGQLGSTLSPTPENLERLTQHITSFSLAGLRETKRRMEAAV